jgi:hypothetical protein
MRVVRDSRYNVAPWNINQRRLEGSFDEGFRVDGEPLGFYHFTGFDSGAHEEVLGRYAPENGATRMLVDWYRLRTESLAGSGSVEWGLGRFNDGVPIEERHRRLYRLRNDLQEAFPDPFEVGGREMSYRRWFRDNAAREHPELFTAPAEEEARVAG